jgi:hypothetical protein
MDPGPRRGSPRDRSSRGWTVDQRVAQLTPVAEWAPLNLEPPKLAGGTRSSAAAGGGRAMDIPPFGPEFFDWLRTTTEQAWAETSERTLADFQREGVGGTTWRKGRRWTGGLSDAEMADVPFWGELVG